MKNFIPAILVLFLSVVIVIGQSSSGVTGMVTDPAGGVVPGVRVLLTDTKTSVEIESTTGDDGTYAFNKIVPGAGYRLTFIRDGFQQFVINNIHLGIGRIETHNAQLSAGGPTETVEVESSSGDASLNTTDASIGNIIGPRSLRELPIQFRGSPAALIGLQPGAIGSNTGTFGVNQAGSVTGSRADQGNITVDGVDVNDQISGVPFATVGNAPIDSIQEFRAVTAGFIAADGRSSGGQIKLKTNSGGNEFRGSLREYFRSDKTAANGFFNNRNRLERRQLDRHQFGGSIGGPLPIFNFGENEGSLFRSGRDKLFFFFDLEARRDRSTVPTSRVVPLQSFRDGNINYLRATSSTSGLACPSNARLDTRPDCIGTLTPAQIQALDPRGVGVNAALLSFINSRYPLPNDVSGGDGRNTGLIRWNAPDTIDTQIYTGRIDATPTAYQRFFARLTVTRADQTSVLEFLPGDGDSVRLDDKSYSFAGGHTWIISPSVTNVITLGLVRHSVYFPVADIPTSPIRFDGGPLGEPYLSRSYSDRNVRVPVFQNDTTWTAGSHTFTFGGTFKPIRQDSSLINDFLFVRLGIGGSTMSLNGLLRPPGIGATGVAGYDSAFTYLLGRFASINAFYTFTQEGEVLPNGTGRKRRHAYNEYELYASDNWKPRGDLTVNLGLHYHLNPPPYELDGFQADANMSLADFMQIRIANAEAGIFGSNAEPFFSYDLSGKANDGHSFYRTDTNNLSPRLGFAYNPSFGGGLLGAIFGDRKTVIRGSASRMFDRPAGAITILQDQLNYLFDNNSQLISFGAINPITALLNDPRFTGPTTLPFVLMPPVISRPFTPNVVNGNVGRKSAGAYNYAIDRDFQTPYSYVWNLGMQREMPGNMLLDVAYVGRLGKRLFAQTIADQTLNFKDAASGQYMYDALNVVQAALQAGSAASAIPAQPWIENQVNPAAIATFGVPCTSLGSPSCTAFVAGFASNAFKQGGTATLIYTLSSVGLLRPNVGMSNQFAINTVVSNYGSSEYHGMLLSVQKRLSRGFEFKANYTWSHSVDNQSSITSTSTGGFLCDFTDLRVCRGDSDFDVRHLFNANYIWDLPFGRGRQVGGGMNPWADAFLGGWTLSGIAYFRTGFPINSTTGSYMRNAGVAGPAVFEGDPSLLEPNIHDEGDGIQFFADPAAVQAAMRYPRHGEMGQRNIFRSPSFWSMDMAVSKKFSMPWADGHRLSIRAEAFNVLNRNSFAFPSLLFESATFGRISQPSSIPRELQFAVRYDF